MIVSEHGVVKIVSSIYVLDPLSVTLAVFSDFDSLLSTKPHQTNSYKNYEAIFATKVARYHSHGKTLELKDSILEMMLLSGSEIDGQQRLSI